MEIRPRSDGDLDGLVALAARVQRTDGYPIYLPRWDFHRFLTHPVPVDAWVATHDRKIVGHAALNSSTSPAVMELAEEICPNERALFVARLLVHPDARRLGIGGSLLRAARQRAWDLGATPMLDVVDIEKARPAIELYRTSGWIEVGRVSFDLLDEEVYELVFQALADEISR